MKWTLPIALAVLLSQAAPASARTGREVLPMWVIRALDTGCRSASIALTELRASLNYCEADSDCITPYGGICPSGPYYVNASSDHVPLGQGEQDLQMFCVLPQCEAWRELGPGRCQSGRCSGAFGR